MENIKNIAVIGGGTMGVGIIQTLSNAGFNVIFKELTDDLVKKGNEKVKRLYGAALKKGKITEEEVNKKLATIKGVTDYTGINEVDMLIEAIDENVTKKKALFKDLDAICKPETIFATNTSAIPITDLASSVNRKPKFIGMHWFNPAHVMRLVEIIPGLETSEETVQTLMDVSKKFGKSPIRLKECPGFLINRQLAHYVNEAFWLLGDGYKPMDIDLAGIEMGMPMGPFFLGDMSGWDVVYHANETLYDAYGSRNKIPPRFEELVAAGKLGVKTMEGVYKYEKSESGPPKQAGDTTSVLSKEERKALSLRILVTMVNESVRCLDEGIASAEDIDKSMQLGAGMPKGPLHLADEIGLDVVLAELDSKKKAFGERYWPLYCLRRKVLAGHTGVKAGKGFFDYTT